MHLYTVSEWLNFIDRVHPESVALGLDRVKKVASRLSLLLPSCPVIIVGGTNGKGSTVAGLAAIYRAAGYRVGTFTSPFLFKINEQVCVNAKEASDQDFCDAFAAIETARANILLTPFEFLTLAALLIFKAHTLDLLILEVGLGGRLDAVNILEATVSIVTSIDIDHVDWLGDTREKIAFEKAGIYRKNKPAICGDSHPPQTLIDYANQIKAPLLIQGRDFFYKENKTTWSWEYKNTHYDKLPINHYALQNMSTVLMGVNCLQKKLAVSKEAIYRGLSTITLAARIQIIEGPITHIYDVSHNPAAISLLAIQLKNAVCSGKTHAVFSMLIDKDIVKSIGAIKNEIEYWHIASLQTKRAASLPILLEAFQQAEISAVASYGSIEIAYQSAIKKTKSGDRIVVFGSFHTIAESLKSADILNPLACISTS